MSSRLEDLSKSTLGRGVSPTSGKSEVKELTYNHLTSKDRVKKLEEELQVKNQQYLRAIESRNVAFQEKLDKKVAGMLLEV
jgi:hypothetical protein